MGTSSSQEKTYVCLELVLESLDETGAHFPPLLLHAGEGSRNYQLRRSRGNQNIPQSSKLFANIITPVQSGKWGQTISMKGTKMTMARSPVAVTVTSRADMTWRYFSILVLIRQAAQHTAR